MNIAVNEFLRKLVGEDFYVTTTSKISYYRHLKKYYKESRDGNIDIEPSIVFMADGRIKHGGLADRLRGAVSLYLYSQLKNERFYIHFVHPFKLENYLEPNEYDWRIASERLTYDSRKAKAILVKHSRKDDLEHMEKLISPFLGKKQLHIYTNTIIPSPIFSKAFWQLFRPTGALQQEIDYNLKAIGSDFVSVTFRFQQLLGDFKEGNYKILHGAQRDSLLNICLDFIEEVHRKYPVEDRILITSDSHTFLENAQSRYNYVYIIPGVVHHIDFTEENNNLAYMKSFVDMIMLSHSKCLYNFSCGPMYKKSGFAMFAAIIGNKPFRNIVRR